LEVAGRKAGFRINEKKTKALIQSRKRSYLDKGIDMGDHRIEVVHKFVYLGVCLNKPK
jgi:hypothetical protein